MPSVGAHRPSIGGVSDAPACNSRSRFSWSYNNLSSSLVKGRTLMPRNLLVFAYRAKY